MSISLTNRKLPSVHLSKKPPVAKPPRIGLAGEAAMKRDL